MSFVKAGNTSIIVSSILVVLSILALFVPGLNLGVDFTGGTILEREVSQQVTTGQLTEIIDKAVPELDLSGAVIQLLDDSNEFMVRTRELSNDEIIRIDTALDGEFGGLIERKTDVVGPVIGQELVRNAILAVLVASIGIVAYVSVRFELRFAISAILALIHNVLIVMAVFAITGREINSPFVAAILTVLGYGINDTIVIFDRIRENLRFRKRESHAELVEKSIRQSLSRTINTSVTTFALVAMLVLFGGSAIQDFAFAMALGVIVATYSSIMLASPIWLKFMEKGTKKVVAAK